MSWASEVAATQLVDITAEQFFSFAASTNITLNPRELIHVEVDVDFPGSPTDDAVISVYGSLDGGTDYDDTPAMQFAIDSDTDPNQASFVVVGLYSFRIGIKRSGTTDTIPFANARHRKDGVSA